MVGVGVLTRVERRDDLPEGLAAVERLGTWQGMPTLNAVDLHEDADGSLWLASDASLVHVPAEARRRRPAPPRVVQTEAAVDGRRLPDDRPIVLPYRRNRLELRFAALSYRDRGLVRYRVRLHEDEEWSAPTDNPQFRFVDLPPGRYEAEVAASLDGARWSAVPARLEFRVGRPWYLEPWFFLLALFAVAAALHGAYRVRVAQKLRLERQRTRIAMDLHDEVGSGLGSIGILGGLLGDPALQPAQRRDLASRIAATAAELNASLGDIVWSLRESSGSVEGLAAYLVERATQLFPGDEPSLHLSLPDPWPHAPLDLAVRRNVLLVALEALHNAARHARARRVELALAQEDRHWRLVVADDGRGIDAAGRRGMGLENMRRRAEEIGATLSVDEPPGGGTRVALRFDPGRRMIVRRPAGGGS